MIAEWITGICAIGFIFGLFAVAAMDILNWRPHQHNFRQRKDDMTDIHYIFCHCGKVKKI